MTTMSALPTRLVRRLRVRGTDLDSTEPTFHGIIGYTDDTRGWDPRFGALSSPIDSDTARARHFGRREWSCVLRSSGRIVVVAQLTNGELRVMRFDGADSHVEETREFHPIDDQLWLRSIKRVNAAPVGSSTITDWFTWVRPGTSATWTRFDAVSPQGRQFELRLEWDAAGNWFAAPAWDQYEHLIEPTDLLARLWPESAGATAFSS